DLLGDWFWTTRCGVNKYPICFAFREYGLISNEAIAPQGPHLSPIRHPGQHGYLIIEERGFEVLDAVHPDEPCPALFPREPRSAASLGVADRRVLHPLNVSDTVDVAISIHNFGSHSDLQTKYRVHLETQMRTAECRVESHFKMRS